jgi:hypothetical protein
MKLSTIFTTLIIAIYSANTTLLNIFDEMLKTDHTHKTKIKTTRVLKFLI